MVRARHVALALACAALAGCGGGGAKTQTSTVTEGGGGAKAGSLSAGAPATTPSSTTPSSTTPACGDGGCAVREVARRGFTANSDTFDRARNLNVVLGVRTGSADGTLQQAFFFWRGRYIGTDTSDVSAGIRFAGTSDDTISLTYRLYKPRDPQCCSTAGETTVRYQWRGRLVPLDAIPPSNPSVSGSRR